MAFMSNSSPTPPPAGSKFHQLGRKEQVGKKEVGGKISCIIPEKGPCTLSLWAKFLLRRKTDLPQIILGIWKRGSCALVPREPHRQQDRVPQALCVEVCLGRKVLGSLTERLGNSTRNPQGLKSTEGEVPQLSWSWCAEHFSCPSYSTWQRQP